MLKICDYYKVHELAGYMVNWLMISVKMDSYLCQPVSVNSASQMLVGKLFISLAAGLYHYVLMLSI